MFNAWNRVFCYENIGYDGKVGLVYETLTVLQIQLTIGDSPNTVCVGVSIHVHGKAQKFPKTVFIDPVTM